MNLLLYERLLCLKNKYIHNHESYSLHLVKLLNTSLAHKQKTFFQDLHVEFCYF